MLSIFHVVLNPYQKAASRSLSHDHLFVRTIQSLAGARVEPSIGYVVND